jgi:hypothetical protein
MILLLLLMQYKDHSDRFSCSSDAPLKNTMFNRLKSEASHSS